MSWAYLLSLRNRPNIFYDYLATSQHVLISIFVVSILEMWSFYIWNKMQCFSIINLRYSAEIDILRAIFMSKRRKCLQVYNPKSSIFKNVLGSVRRNLFFKINWYLVALAIGPICTCKIPISYSHRLTNFTKLLWKISFNHFRFELHWKILIMGMLALGRKIKACVWAHLHLQNTHFLPKVAQFSRFKFGFFPSFPSLMKVVPKIVL